MITDTVLAPVENIMQHQNHTKYPLLQYSDAYLPYAADVPFMFALQSPLAVVLGVTVVAGSMDRGMS